METERPPTKESLMVELTSILEKLKTPITPQDRETRLHSRKDEIERLLKSDLPGDNK